MKAMVITGPGQGPDPVALPDPEPGPGQVRIRVEACAVCRTDLHLLDGDLPMVRSPVVPGHQVVGVIDRKGSGASRFGIGDRVGLAWLGWACGRCDFCLRGQENLCPEAKFTGYHLDGGFAELTLADERFCYPILAGVPAEQAAPLLCGGLIGYRALRFTGDAHRLGLYGFGSAAHMIQQVAIHQGRRVFAFTRAGDQAAIDFARELGAEWAGDSLTAPPEPLDAAIIFAPAGELVPAALAAVRPGGVVVCAGIHMSDIPSFPYRLLWGERVLRSVANLTRADGEEFLRLAPTIPVRIRVERFPLEAAGDALHRLRSGRIRGTAVLLPN